MSHFAGDIPQRPTVRRKSSAQNLLSSFISSNSSSSANIALPPAPLNIASSSASSATAVSFGNVIATATPMSTTPLPREWDAQSMHSETVGSTLAGAGSPPLGQGTTVEYLRDLVQKRIITLTYIRNIHEGHSHWFHTILISRSDLDKAFNNVEMKKQTHRFAILGLSLSNLLDINQPQDLLRGLLNTVTEFDTSIEDSDKTRVRTTTKRLFRPKGKRGISGVAEYTGPYTEVTDASYLMMPHMPFPLDYHQTLLSMLDVLSEVYNKISRMLGPSPFPHSTQQMMGPLGLLSPQPGVSYLFAADNNNVNFPNSNQNSNTNLHQAPPFPNNGSGYTDTELSGSLWSIANPTAPGVGGTVGALYGGALGSPPVMVWAASLGDMVLKIDGKLKKITSSLLKNLDTFARNGIRDELTSLNPLLKNMSTDDRSGGKITYDFEV